mmetsp:Transcript_9813/g.21588  ORF Transcript_9813/g.21588 Transcript_9813/m.21588 type:complete len:97 (-) Transcript_9813:130-420(-)
MVVEIHNTPLAYSTMVSIGRAPDEASNTETLGPGRVLDITYIICREPVLNASQYCWWHVVNGLDASAHNPWVPIEESKQAEKSCKDFAADEGQHHC